MLVLEKKLAQFGIQPGLERIRTLCIALDNPQQKMKVILITGTNGKGSVTSYLAAILKEEGYKVGSYFSPHIFKYNERFKINGKDITESELKKYEKRALALLKKGYEMTLFEALTAIAYAYFADKECDFAVMEIGMGGTYDATNVAEEVISIITNIDLEHTEYLGDTIEKIARDKAGVIKTGICITGAHTEALDTIEMVAKERNKVVRALNRDFFTELRESTSEYTRFNYVGHSYYNALTVQLAGDYQVNNAALAVAAAEELGVDEKAIRKGLEKTKHPYRLQLISRKPSVLVDAAHNAHGIGSLISNLHLFNFKKLVCIFSCLQTKNWQEMLRLLAPHCDELILTQIPGNPLTAKSAELATIAEQYTSAVSIPELKKAVALAKKEAGKNDLILICGSIYLLATAIAAIKKR